MISLLEGMHLNIDIKGLSTDSVPVTATRPELMRRMKDMAAVGGGMALLGMRICPMK